MRKTNRVAIKGEEQCHHCDYAAEVTVTNGTITIRVCPTHSWTYTREGKLTVTPDADSNVAICPTCSRVIGHKANAAHHCYAPASS